jgi:ribosomal protein L12E/L44/L45/RPP1/RPP2
VNETNLSRLIDAVNNALAAVNSGIAAARYATKDDIDQTAADIKAVLEAVGVDSAKIQALADALANVQFTEKDPTVSDWAKQPTKPTYTAAEVGAATAAQGAKADTALQSVFTPRFWQFTMNAATAGSMTQDATLPFDTLSYSTGESDVALNSNKLITIKPGRYMCIVSFMTSGATGAAPTVTALRRKAGDTVFTRIPMLNISGNAGPVTVSFVVNYTDTYEVGIGCNNGTITWNTNTPQARLMIMRVA